MRRPRAPAGAGHDQPLERRPLDELRDDRGMVPPDERHLVRLHRVRVHDIGGTLRRATESDERRVWLVVRGEVVDLHRDWPADERIGLEDPAVGGRRSAATELAERASRSSVRGARSLVERRREGGRSGHPGPRSPIATTEPSPSTLGAVEYRRTFECGGKASDLPWGPIDPRLRIQETSAAVVRPCTPHPRRRFAALWKWPPSTMLRAAMSDVTWQEIRRSLGGDGGAADWQGDRPRSAAEAGLTLEDVRNPHDFPELGDPDWHYEDGVLTGIQSVRTALRARAAGADRAGQTKGAGPTGGAGVL